MSDDVHLTGTVTVPNNWRESSANSDQRMMEMQTYTQVPEHNYLPLQYKPFELPKYTWKLVIGHGEIHGISIGYTDEQLPCWFHRKMQELILGFKWSKL